MSELPRWFRLLQEWQTRRYGLTLPFLIGALRCGSPSREPLADIAALLTAFREEAPEEHFILVARCYNIQEIVAAPGLGGPPSRGIPFFSSVQERNTLFIEAPIFAESAEITIEAATHALGREYGQYIARGDYSVQNGVWAPFTAKDLVFIGSAI